MNNSVHPIIKVSKCNLFGKVLQGIVILYKAYNFLWHKHLGMFVIQTIMNVCELPVITSYFFGNLLLVIVLNHTAF
ncbi:hypothetical protein EXU57_24470 [Segetibacter sp. 3557_3]|uniref:hypothetical protein n=1 Tax=Segetibacter sp. 3557_3 TaxID=2547429 RepID=UPI001058BEF1|nr:hypothetical protein [Segetibacter sp. 3557_3]TDH18033.1 hypothetical protein EXU57_24470 [Segetibacter sp. 3557_3]